MKRTKIYRVYSGSILIGKVEATDIGIATRNAVKKWWLGVWLRV